MKKIDEAIETSKKTLDETIEQYENTSPDDVNTLKRLDRKILELENYIKGLEIAKKLYEEER